MKPHLDGSVEVKFRYLRWVIAAAQHRNRRQAAEAIDIPHSTVAAPCLRATLFDGINAGIRSLRNTLRLPRISSKKQRPPPPA